MRVWKYEVTEELMALPEGAKVLHVARLDGHAWFWALANPDAPRVSRQFRIRPTGHESVDPSFVYVGTFFGAGGLTVWHVFEEPLG